VSEGIKILAGVDVPSTGSGRPIKYDFEKMSVGDHFIWKCKPGENVAVRRASISVTAKQRGFKVVTRVQGSMIKVWLKEILDAEAV
jgi:hypothetical protein